MPRIVGMGAFTAVVLAVFDYTGGSLRGWAAQTNEDRFEQKEYLRKNRRRPMEETLAQLGDGRGGSKCGGEESSMGCFPHSTGTRADRTVIHSPNYNELRVERLKEKYGYEIKTVSADPNAQ